jgi:polar amino acid transport system substrate-binding protein
MKMVYAVCGAVVGAAVVGAVWYASCPGGHGPRRGGGQDDVLARVKERNLVRVGVKADAPPFGIRDEFGYSGFDIDIATALARELGIEEVEFVTVTSADRLDKVASREVDMAIASMTITRSREEKVDFTIPYFQDGQALMVRRDSQVSGYVDLAGKAVGGVRGATSVENIREVQPDCEVREYPGYKEALEGLRKGEVEAITTDMLILVGLRLGAEDPDGFRIVGERFSTEPYGIAVAENQSKWRDALNDAIQRLWERGVWQKVYESWFGEKARYHTDVEFMIVPFPR